MESRTTSRRENAGLPPVMDPAAPVTVLRPGGAAPLLLLGDHASNALPEHYGRLGLEAQIFSRHVAYDIGVAPIIHQVAEALDAPAVLGNFSRLLIDPNRTVDHPTLIPADSDGVHIVANANIDDQERQYRLQTFYEPFHEAVGQQRQTMMRHGQVPAVVGIHSFTPIMQGAGRPWHAGILWNKDPRLAAPLITYLRDAGFDVGDNLPYSGRVLGYTMNRHGDDHGLPHAVIEIRQDLISGPKGQQQWAELIINVLRRILDEQAPFAVQYFDKVPT